MYKILMRSSFNSCSGDFHTGIKGIVNHFTRIQTFSLVRTKALPFPGLTC